MNNDRCRREWLAALAIATRPMDPEKAAANLVKMLPLLADYPDDAFNAQTLKAVASAATVTPNYRQITTVFDAWRGETFVPPRPLPSPESFRPTSQYPSREEIAASWQDAANVRASIRRIQELEHEEIRVTSALQRALIAALTRHAPGHLGLLPPAWLERGTAE